MTNICLKCHREIHADELLAEALGWIVMGRGDPANVPFRVDTGAWVLPRPDGTLEPVGRRRTRKLRGKG
jgi:hypothetical protein